MVVTNTELKTKVIKKLENILNEFGKEVFNKDNKVSIELESLDLQKKIIGNLYFPTFYKDGKIYINSNYLDIILNNHKSNPRLIHELMKSVIHEYVHVILDTDLKKKEVKENLIIHESLATLFENIYNTISLDFPINKNKDIEESIEKINKYVINKLKDPNYLEKLENNMKKDIKEKLDTEMEELLKKYDKCINISYTSLDILDLYHELKYYFLYRIPALLLQKNVKISELIKDLSEKKSIDKYKEIIYKEFENLEKNNIIKNLLDCTEYKLNKHLDYYSKFLESKILNLGLQEIAEE
ncbi:MAG: hypothetical protein QXG71_01465 [Nanopusillaceae archaeon]